MPATLSWLHVLIIEKQDILRIRFFLFDITDPGPLLHYLWILENSHVLLKVHIFQLS